MPILPKIVLKTFFERGDIPTEAQFASLIDSGLNLLDDRRYLGLKIYDPQLAYTSGDTVVYNGLIYQANAPTSGPFDNLKWDKLVFGPLQYAGTWDASTNVSPTLQSSQGNRGDYYIVRVSGNFNLDGETNWNIRDWAVFNGTKWERVNNADLGLLTASMVSFDNAVTGIVATDVQGAIDEVETRVDTAETDIDSLQTTLQAHTSNTANPHGVTKAQIGLPNVEDLKNNLTALADPSALSDASQGYAAGSRWINTTTGNEFVCISPVAGAAVWKQTTGGGTATDIQLTPVGSIQSTNVQAAVQELDSDVQSHTSNTANPHGVTKAQIGLPNVEDLKNNLTATGDPAATNDASQGYAAGSRWINTTTGNEFVCISPAAGAAVWKQTTGGGTATDIQLTPVGSIQSTNVQAAVQELDGDVQAHLANTSNPHGVTKAQVGLGNVDNTSDASKPVSTAQQAALNLKVDAVTGKQLSTEDYTTAEKSKLAGIAANATANATDAQLRDRSTHTGTQTASTISDFQPSVLATVLTGLSTAVNAVISASDTILAAMGKLQRQISDLLSSFNAHAANTSNPHNVTKAQVGLNSVTDDQQLSLKTYSSDETTAFSNDTTAFSTSPAEPLKYYLTSFTVTGGIYLVEWYFELGSDVAACIAEGRVLIDDITPEVSIHTQTIDTSRTYVSCCGFCKYTFSEGTHSVRIQIRKVAAAGPSTMKRARVKITKI